MLCAAIDIGSNTTRVLVAEPVGGQLKKVMEQRAYTRINKALDEDGAILPEKIDEVAELVATQVRLARELGAETIRSVATAAVREASNGEDTARAIAAASGVPVDILSDEEEGRLSFIGATKTLGHPVAGKVGVVDVGGGSTEFIVGTGLEPQLTESLYMGCVSYSLKYFPDGKVDKAAMRAAELAARQELAGIVRAYRAAGWDEAVASSGTARAIENILRENGFAEDGLTRAGLEKLRSLLLKSEKADPDRIAGLRPNRAPVLPGGVAILSAAFEELGLEAMKVSAAALRHGVLYDLLGRVEHRDMREATVAQFMRRYHVDTAQAERVKQLALTIYDALTPGAEREDDADRLMLEWAARLAEIGLSIAHAQYHKHSAYVLSNADMPGFSRPEQARLARIVLAHRGKLRKMQDAGLDGADWKLVFALRTASLILRSRSDAKLPFLRVAADAGGFAIDLPQSWLDESPLSAAALDAESDHWKAVGMKLQVSGLSDKRVSVLKQVR